MKRMLTSLAAILAWAMVVSYGAGAVADTAALSALNDMRAKSGRAPLSYSAELEQIALRHAQDLALRGVLSHDSADGSGPGDRARAAGYGWCRISENVAQGQGSLGQVMTGWNRSKPHRKNMMDRKITEFGLARSSGNFWVMVMAQPGC